eukprot:Sspe_Gene.2570::Locus_865_Transcript_1_1_Confidence_1.000_Length_4959::g.2570::m.2570
MCVRSLPCASGSGCAVAAPCLQHEREAGCVDDTFGCVWKNGRCDARPCRYARRDRCLGDPRCGWVDTVRGLDAWASCIEVPCKGLNRTECTGTGGASRCAWSGGTCAAQGCAGHGDEGTCRSEAGCTWDSGCRVRAECREEGGGDPSQCKIPRCEAAASARECRGGCLWKGGRCADWRVANCPALDVVVVLDGSPDMTRAFASHPHGFLGATGALREWAALFPETPTDGFPLRAAFVAYSSGPVLASGRGLSSQAPELLADLAWLEHNYPTTVPVTSAGIAASFGEAVRKAAAVFRSGGAGRRRLLLVAGRTARDGPAFAQSSRHLTSLGVETFAVCLQRTSSPSPEEEAAATILRRIATPPSALHFASLPLARFASEVLMGLCNIDTTFGRAVLPGVEKQDLPCALHKDIQRCEAEKCDWMLSGDGRMRCESSVCLSLDEGDCQQNGCWWTRNGTAPGTCRKPHNVCTFLADCGRYDACEWRWGQCVPACPGGSEESCLASAARCVWTADGCHRAMPDNETVCSNTPDCVWDPVTQQGFTRCSAHKQQHVCALFDKCEWNGTCVEKGCAKSLNEVSCASASGCEWSTSAPPGGCVPCSTSCVSWSETCVATANNMCCAGCARGAAGCAAAHFLGCPPMHLVVVFDGSDAMSMKFGRHSSGFQGVTHVLRKWGSSLPLGPTMAVGVVQFAGTNRSTAPHSNDGAPSTSRSGLDADLAWHARNQLRGPGGGDVAQVLASAATLLRSAPLRSRKVVLIISAGGLTQKTSQPPPDILVAAVQLRRSALKTPLDEDDLWALKKMPVSSAESLDLPGLHDALEGMCDRTSTLLGSRLGEGAIHRKCSKWGTREECQGDTFCTWNGMCEESRCRKYCNEAGCKADKDCRWMDNNCHNEVCDYPDEAGCGAHVPCTWHNSTCQANLCASQFTVEGCHAIPPCQWVERPVTNIPRTSECRETNCSALGSPSECSTSKWCRWVLEQCIDVCEVNNARPLDCAAGVDCVYDTRNEICTSNCSAKNHSECNTSCSWQELSAEPPRCDVSCALLPRSVCKEFRHCTLPASSSATCAQKRGPELPCRAANDTSTCRAWYPRCVWYASVKCSQNECDLPPYECNRHPRCALNGTACLLKPCETPDVRECEANPKCSVVRGGREEHCEAYTDPCASSRKEECSAGTCQWYGARGCKTNCVRTCRSGSCSSDGCCACKAGWFGRDCEQCSLYLTRDNRCVACDPEGTCHGNGECVDGVCQCRPAYTGKWCEIRRCLPEGPQWYTLYPNRPVRNTNITLIIHGCFGKSPKVKVVPGVASCNSPLHPSCVKGGRKAGENQTFPGEHSSMVYNSSCREGVSLEDPLVEPQREMELLVGVKVVYDELEDRRFKVCVSDESGVWEEVETHDRDGVRQATFLVQGKLDKDTGAVHAAGRKGWSGADCCEGVQMGSACVPGWVWLVVLLVVLGVAGYLSFAVWSTHKEKMALRRRRQDLESAGRTVPLLDNTIDDALCSDEAANWDDEDTLS